jgi:hypothetical protein
VIKINVLKFKSFDDPETNFALEMNPKSTSIYENECKNLQNYLQKIINRFVKVDFLIGSDNIISKEGLLKEVGSDYIVLEMLSTNDLLICDIYSIKFVQII